MYRGDRAPAAAPLRPRVVVLGDDDAGLAGIETAVRAGAPELDVSVVPPEVVIRSVVAECVILDARVGGRPNADVLRALRAGGFVGGVVLLADGGGDAHDVDAFARYGAEGPVPKGGPPEALRGALLPAIDRALASSRESADGATAAVERERRRTRQLVAAGELALSLQHALSNPLTALLAEAQLLEMELEDAEHRAAAGRIVELCRRTIGVARQLDDVAPSA